MIWEDKHHSKNWQRHCQQWLLWAFGLWENPGENDEMSLTQKYFLSLQLPHRFEIVLYCVGCCKCINVKGSFWHKWCDYVPALINFFPLFCMQNCFIICSTFSSFYARFKFSFIFILFGSQKTLEWVGDSSELKIDKISMSTGRKNEIASWHFRKFSILSYKWITLLR